MSGQREVRKVFLDWQILLSLCLLLGNDIWWKYEYSNFLTGKLSDVAGLFMVGAILARSQPSAAKRWLVGVGVAFCFWKSPLSQPLIDSVNLLLPYSIGRVVDYSDFLALSVLLFAHPHFRTRLLQSWRLPSMEAVASGAVGGVVVLAIMGTSVIPLREEFAIRESGGERILSNEAVAIVVQRVAAKHDLMECAVDVRFTPHAMDKRWCEESERDGFWGFWMAYGVSEDTEKVNIVIHGSPGGPLPIFPVGSDRDRMITLREDLALAFEREFGDIELAFRVDEDDGRPLKMVD